MLKYNRYIFSIKLCFIKLKKIKGTGSNQTLKYIINQQLNHWKDISQQ